MISAPLLELLDRSTVDAITASVIKPVLHVSGNSSVVIDHRFICSLKVSQLKDILLALREIRGISAQFRYILTPSRVENLFTFEIS